MTESGFDPPRDAAKPPSNVRLRRRRSRRKPRVRMLLILVVLILLASGAWGVSSYLASAPKRAEAAFQNGSSLMALGQYQEAAKSFTKAIQIRPRMAAAYLQRGLAQRGLNQADVALADFERAVGLDPTLAEAHTAMGSIYGQRGDLKRAEKEFEQAIALGSTVDANFQRGKLHESLGDHRKALEDYNLAVEQKPDSPFGYRARAQVREALGDPEGAADDRRKANSIEHPGAFSQ